MRTSPRLRLDLPVRWNAYGPAMSEEHDLVVVGSGGAAMAAGIHARSQGKSVLLVERAVIGGTCLNIGCVPSKTLLAASGQREHALHSPFPGAPTSAGSVDLGALVAQKDELVSARCAALAAVRLRRSTSAGANMVPRQRGRPQ